MAKKEKRLIIIKNALKALGKPYKYGATLDEAPDYFDCSGFVKYLFGLVGIRLPRNSIDQAGMGIEIPKNKIESCDVIFVKKSQGRYNEIFPDGIGHVLLYLGKNKVIHAAGNTQHGIQYGKVIMENADIWLNRKDFRIIKRYLIEG